MKGTVVELCVACSHIHDDRRHDAQDLHDFVDVEQRCDVLRLVRADL